jgi:ArsR family transcriptional regulator
MSIDINIESQQARFLRCIGEPTRLRIIKLLSEGEKHVADICQAIGKDQPLVSHHLRALRECGIVSARQETQKVYYRLCDKGMASLVMLTGDIVAKLAPCQPGETCFEEKLP